MINQQLNSFFSVLPGWLAIILVVTVSLLCVTFAVGFSFIFIREFFKIRWKILTVWHRIRVKNIGNAPGYFRVHASSPNNELGFQFYYLGRQLPTLTEPPPILLQSSNGNSRQGGSLPAQYESSMGPIKSLNGPALQNPASLDASKKALSKKADGAKKKTEKGLASAKLFGTILGTLGSLLPGSLGASLKEQSTAVQNKAQSVGATIQMPEEKLKTAQALQGQVKNLKPGENIPLPELQKPSLSTPLNVNDTPPVLDTAPNALLTGENVFNPGRSLMAVNKTEDPELFVQSPEIQPEGYFNLDIRIDPANRYLSQDYPFSVVVSRYPNNAEDGRYLPEPVKLSQSISITGISILYRLLSYLLSTIVVAFNVLWLTFLIRLLIGFVS